MRATLLVASLFATVADTATATTGGDFELLRYAITQGGLLAIVLVLCWSYRRDFVRVLSRREDELKVMTDIVANSTTALTRTADATERMARAVELMERSIK